MLRQTGPYMGIKCLCLGAAKFARLKKMNVSFIKQNAPFETRCLLFYILVADRVPVQMRPSVANYFELIGIVSCYLMVLCTTRWALWHIL